jgi:hypothetical protein
MARRGRLPRAAGRPPRFLRTDHRRAISLSEAHLQAARGTPDTRSRVTPRVALNRRFPSASRACGRKGRHFASWPRATPTSTRRSLARWAARRRRGRRRPGHRSQTKGAVLREAAALPRLSGSRRGKSLAGLRSRGPFWVEAATRRGDPLALRTPLGGSVTRSIQRPLAADPCRPASTRCPELARSRWMAAAAETPALLLSRYSGTTRQSRRARLRTDHRAVAEPGHSDGLYRLVPPSSGSPVSFRAAASSRRSRLAQPLSERRSAAVDGLSDAIAQMHNSR